MKKTMLFVLGAIVLLSASSCKKGDNDPFLSLKSRKARLAGGYVVSKMESTETTTYETYETTTTQTFDGTTLFEKIINSTTESYDYPVSVAEWVFKKDGTWEMAWKYKKTVINDDVYYKTTTVTDYDQTQSGVWAFVGKTKKEYKNKERVQLSILKDDVTSIANIDDYDKTYDTTYVSKTTQTSNATYMSGENVVIYDIDMLKNKEMVFKLSQNEDISSHFDDGSTTPNDYSEKSNLEKTMTLKQIKK